MKKFKIALAMLLILAILCAMLLTACVKAYDCEKSGHKYDQTTGICAECGQTKPDETPPHEHNHQKVVNNSTFTLECSCGDKITDGYRIQFVYAEDGTEADAGIEVSWIDQNDNAFTATTNELGYVEALQLPNESYKLSLNEETFPNFNGVEYLCSVSSFPQQQKGVGLIIPLFAVHQPDNATQSGITGRPIDINTGEITETTNTYSIQLNKTYIATINSANDQVWYTLQHDGFGDYTVDASAFTDIDVKIEKFNASMAYIPSSPDDDVDDSQPNKLTYAVTKAYRTSQSTFRIMVENVTEFPVQIPFIVTISYKPTDVSVDAPTIAIPTHFQTEETVFTWTTEETDASGKNTTVEHSTFSLKPAEDVEKCPDFEGAVIKNLTKSQFETMQKAENGYYYTTDGKIVYAKLDAPSIFFSSSTTIANYAKFAQYDRFIIYKVAKYDKYGCCTENTNYFPLSQAYAQLVNNDGLYPLTEELIPLLERVVAKESAANLQYYLYDMLCTYATQVNNWTQGDGSQANPFAITLETSTLGNYNVSIPANGKVYVTLNGDMEVVFAPFNSNVKATVTTTGEPFEYTQNFAVNGTATVVFESKDGSAVDFVWNISEYDNPYYLELGENLVTAPENVRSIRHGFEATETGSYVVTISTPNVVVTATTPDNQEIVIDDQTAPFELQAGQTIYFVITPEVTEDTVGTPTFQEDFAFVLTIEKTTQN